MPHEIATQEKPNLAGLLEWGSRIWVKRLDVQKLEPWALEAVFVGYDDKLKGYRVYWPSKRHVSIERDVYLTKTKHFYLIPSKLRGRQTKGPILTVLRR